MVAAEARMAVGVTLVTLVTLVMLWMLLATSRVTMTAMNATTTVETGALRVIIPEDLKETHRGPKIPKDPEDNQRNL
jgi:hypothetical protein